MSDTVNELLHRRIAKACMARYRAGFFKDAAREALTQVELAVKEKSGIGRKYGVRLITSAFGPASGIRLRVSFGQHMQAHAESYFKAVFEYYRNYAHHEGDKIDGPICLRILVVASDLLYLLDASHRSYRAVGGVDGLVKEGVFSSSDAILELLSRLDGYCLPNEISDGFWEDLKERGFTEPNVQSLFDCGLVEYVVDTNVEDRSGHTETVGRFKLTPLGQTVLRRGAS